MTTAKRIQRLLSHLGLERAHFAARMPQDWQDFVASYPEQIASLSLLCPAFIDAPKLAPLAERLLLFSSGIPRFGEESVNEMDSLPAAKHIPFANYENRLWTDIVREKSDIVFQAMQELIFASEVAISDARIEEAGEVAGITYRTAGSGPPLILLPLGLAPSGWEPLLPRLQEHFTTIVLGGAELGLIPMLEQRGLSWGYQKMMRNLFEWIELKPGETVLEVGSGTGVVCRWLAQETGGANPITGVDLNNYLMGEAKVLVQRENLESIIAFQEGNAEALPFADNSFDVIFSTTVMEEANAARMMGELIRVVKPGGRVGVVVRGTDNPFHINLPISDKLRSGFENQQTYDEGERCATATLYRYFQQSTLTDVRFSPQLALFYNPFGVVEQFMMSGYISSLSDEDAAAWQAALVEANQDGTFYLAWPHHAAVGTKSA